MHHSTLKGGPFSVYYFAKFLLNMHTSPAAKAFMGLLNILLLVHPKKKYNPMFEEAGLPLLVSAKDTYKLETFLRHYEVGLWGVR